MFCFVLFSFFLFFYSYLSEALQQAGRNPSYATLNKYWTPKTSTLNFDDFCEILKRERKIEETDLLRAFKKMDDSGDGYISHSELEKALTTVSSTRCMWNQLIWLLVSEKLNPAELNLKYPEKL